MAWPFKKEETPNADPAKAAELEKKEREDFIAALNQNFQSQLAPVVEKVSKMEERWNALETAANTPPPDPDAPPPEPLTAHEKALLAGQIQINARLMEQEIIGAMPVELQAFIPELKNIFANTPVDRKAKPDYAAYCQNCLDMIIGREARKGGVRYDSQNKRFFLESSTANGNDNTPRIGREFDWVDSKGRTVTAEETLDKLGVKPEDLLERAKHGAI